MISGGPQRSLINLLSVIDRNKYFVELLLIRKGGVLYPEIPSFVKISFVRPNGLYCRFVDNRLGFIIYFPLRVLIRLLISVKKPNSKEKLDLFWTVSSFFTREHKSSYDLAIAYIEGFCIKYLATKVHSHLKIARIPTDYKTSGQKREIDLKYFRKMDYLFVVSEENKKILKEVFPEFESQIIVFHSIISPKIISTKSLLGTGFNDCFDGIRILTIARFQLSKGIDLAMEACSILVKQGFNIRWYFLGNGNKALFYKRIEELNVKDNFYFLEELSNPYTYLLQADIYVQPSRYEGKSNAVNEAKSLSKKIIITKFPSASDHLKNMEEGIISEMDSGSIASSIKSIINSPELGESFSANLSRNFKGNESEINKLYQLLNNHFPNQTNTLY